MKLKKATLEELVKVSQKISKDIKQNPKKYGIKPRKKNKK